jgi:AraC-like DNA-binding protein
LLCLFQNLGYIAASLNYIKKNNVPFKSIIRDFEDFSIMNWLQLVVLGYIVTWIVQLNALSVYVILRQPGWCAYTSSIFTLIVLLFTLLIMFLVLMKPEIYYAIKYRNNNLNELSKDEYLRKVNDYLKLEKTYLDPDISLEKVARDISINPRLISQVINELCKKNFKCFVNDFRIRECVRLFSEDTRNEKTIQEVYYMAGFNSRSVFNELFKVHTGLTPKEFRERLKAGQND